MCVVKIYKNEHTIFFYIAMIFMFLTLLFLYGGLFYDNFSAFLPFMDNGGVFRWGTLKIGEKTISLYWTAYFCGLILMWGIGIVRRKQYGLSMGKALLTGFLLLVTVYIGVKMLYILENLEAVVSGEMKIGWSGVSGYGGVFLLPLVMPLIGKLMKKDGLSYLDYCAPTALILLVSIRSGCFVQGCCAGIRIWIASSMVVLPAQLAECTLDLFLLDKILLLERENKYERGRYFIIMGGYGILRFFVEFIRDTSKDIWIFSEGQWLSLICIVIMGIYLAIERNQMNPVFKKNDISGNH